MFVRKAPHNKNEEKFIQFCNFADNDGKQRSFNGKEDKWKRITTIIKMFYLIYY